MKGRTGWGTAALLAAGIAATTAAAQAPPGVQGPLGEPGTTAPIKVKPKPAKRARKHAATPAADLPRDAADASRAPVPTSSHGAAPAADPISLGFKWQGTNDTAEKTRVQNYNGDAAGTGAAVGLKLHF